MTEKTARKAPDWERIEVEYRAGVLSAREIALAHGISHTAINKRAKAEGWDRDLSAQIQAKADALVSKAAVSAAVSTSRLATEREIIESNAERIAQVRGEHRHDITRMRALVLRLLSECEAEAADPEAFERIGELLNQPDDRGIDKLNEAYRKAISLPVRIKGVKELAETMKTLVGMEREAYGIASVEAAKTAPTQELDVTRLSTAALVEIMAARDAQRK